MNPAGPGGTSESNTPHTEGERFGDRWRSQQSGLPPDALMGEMGEPAGDIEIVAVEMEGLPPAGLTGSEDDLDELLAREQGGGWFRWWYVPAVLVPATAGAVVALWLVNRQRQPAVVRATRGLGDRVSGWWDDLTGRSATKKAQKTVRRGVKSAKSSASDLTSRAAAALASAGAPNLAERAGDAVKDALDDASDAVQDALDRVRALWQRTAPSSSATKRQTKSAAAQTIGMLAGWRQSIADWFEGLNATTQRQAATALNDVTAPVRGAARAVGTRTQGAMQSAGDSIGSTARAMRAFTFGAAISAIATYLGITRRRAAMPVTRDTASGRPLPGYRPKFGTRSQQAAAGRGQHARR